MNEMLQVIMNRRSVRNYNGQPITEQELSDIVEAGRFAPTGGNCQTVHFVVLLNANVREELRRLVRNVFSQMKLSDHLYKSIQNSIRLSRKGDYAFDYYAPVLIVVTNEKEYPNAMADSACALQNMMLEAESLGIGSCWINQLHWLDESPEIRQYLKPLGIETNETICGALALGRYDNQLPIKSRTGMRVDYIR